MPAHDTPSPHDRPRIGFLGPAGTFCEQALLSQSDLAEADLVPLVVIGDVLDAVLGGDLDLGFVPIENSIEGTVNQTQDALAFTHPLLIQREVVLDVELCLMAPAGTALSEVREVVSFPHATAQCRGFFARELPGVVVGAANSTAEAAELVGRHRRPGVAAIATSLAAKLYGLDVLSSEVADHGDNQTRFVLVARDGVPAATGHDKTTVLVFQRADEPGSLISILQEFAARRINLSKLESRPTKAGGLGDYCFVIDLDGHIADELVADCLRELHAKQGGVRFLGSYAAAGQRGPEARSHADLRWRQADAWLADLRAKIAER